MLKVKHLTPTQYRVLPWKNGLGTTSEIYIYPENIAFPDDEFYWRVSTAAITSPNKFSQFPDYDRTIILLEGEPLILKHDGIDKPHIMNQGIPHHFKGEWETTCEIGDQPVLDFNLMVKRAQVTSSTQVITLSAVASNIMMTNRFMLIFCVSDPVEINWDGSTKMLARHESLLIESDLGTSPQNFLVNALETKATIILIQINLNLKPHNNARN